MGRARRFLALALALTLMVAFGPAAGAAPVTAGVRKAASARPMLSPTAKAKASRSGIDISISDLGPKVTAVDVFRSTTAGVRGDKVNDEPVDGKRFTDESAKAGVQYYYTVVVTGRKADDDHATKDRYPRFADVDVLPQVKAQVRPADKVQGRDAKPESPRVAKGRKAAAAAAPRVAKAGVSAALVTAKTTVASGTVIGVNTTWTNAMSPIYLSGDVHVAAGKTLTIQPGVEVYFGNFDDGGVYGTDYGINMNPTSRCDLMVHGRLVANGTASMPILFSSVQASLNSTPTDPPPPAGDWGTLFFDSMSASSMSYCTVNYGEGIWAQNTSRPYITNCDITNTGTATGEKPFAAVYFEDPKTDAATPRIRFIGNEVGSEDEGIWIDVTKHSGGMVLDPLITDNTIRADYSIDLEIAASPTASAGDYIVRGYIARNRLYGGASDSDQIYLYVEPTSTGHGTINSQLLDNTVRCPDNSAVYAGAYTDRGHAKIVPTVRGGSYYSYDEGLYMEAYSEDASMTNPGVAWASPVVSSTRIASNDADAIYLYADSAGMGSAKADSSFTNVTFETASSNAIYDYAESEYGPASASPTFTDCVGEAHDASEAIYCEAYSYGAGYAAASPRITRGRFKATDDDCVYNYAESYEGRAAAVVHAHDTNLWGYDSIIYSEAYGDNSSSTAAGGANASTTFVDSTGHGYDDDGIYNFASSDGMGAAHASPLILRSTVTDDYYNGVYCEAESSKSSAYANPRVVDSTIWSEEEAIETSVDQEDSDGVGEGHSHATILRSTAYSAYYPAVDLDVTTNGTGDAHASPMITDSYVANGYDDDGLICDATVNGTGTASIVPEVMRSTLRAEDNCIDLEADGPNAPAVPAGESMSHVGGFFQDTSIYSEDDYAVDLDSENNSGNGADITTRFTRCDITAQDDYGLYADVSGTGPAGTKVTCAPRIISCDARMTADGFYFNADGTSSTTTETVLCAPDIMYTPIYSTWDYGVECDATTDGHGSVTMDAYILRSSIRSYDQCVILDTDSAGTADALNTSKVAGNSRGGNRLEAWWEYGVESDVHSDNGMATEKLQVKNQMVSSYDAAVWSHAAVDVTSTMLATQQTLIDRVKADNKWTFDDDGVIIYASSSGPALLKPTVTRSTIFSPTGDGIAMYLEGTTNNTATPVITGNGISRCGGAGIWFYVSSGPALGMDSSILIRGNSIAKTWDTCVYVEDMPKGTITDNKISYAGNVNSTDRYDSSGIYWSDAAGGSITFNDIRAQRHGVTLESCNPYPVVNNNNFKDLSGRKNQPWNMWTDCPTAGAVNAENNWWGYTLSADITRTINEDSGVDGAVDFLPRSAAYIP